MAHFEYNPMLEAILTKDIDSVRNLLAADYDIINEQEFAPLHIAIGSRDLNIVKLLIGAGVDTTQRAGVLELAPLECALRNNCDLNVIKELFNDCGEDLNTQGEFGRSALYYAAVYNSKEMVEYLLSRGADVNIVDVCNSTPLYNGAYYNKNKSHLKTIKILLYNGASVNALDSYNATPLNKLFSLRKPSIKVVELFLDFKADINIKDRYGRNSFHSTAIEADLEVLKLLIDHGADVNCVSTVDGSTTLHAAYVDQKSVKLLLKTGADIESIDHKGLTPAMCLYTNQIESVKLLLFSLKYADLKKVASDGSNILNFDQKPDVWNIILEHMAKLEALNVLLHETILETILNQQEYENYFKKCSYD